ncbi:MAG: hypothetical protein GY851_09020 [bacterium]|nr:hypothetical protein [bacterium]
MTTPSQILVLGSGKMARNVGAYFMRKGCAVHWASRDPERAVSLAKWVRRARRRLVGLEPALADVPEPAVACIGDGLLPACDFLIECAIEDVQAKQSLLDSVLPRLDGEPIVLSNSSSILPSAIHPDCVGLHFFYPVELTGFVEVVFADSTPSEQRDAVLSLMRTLELTGLEQTEATAFAVNRLPLPLHAECFHALTEGWPRDAVDEATKSDLLPAGQLTVMDAIGVDILLPAARNYVGRLTPETQRDYAALLDGLAQPQTSGTMAAGDGADLARRFLYTFINACYHSVQVGDLTQDALELVLRGLHDAESSLAAAVEREGRARIASELDELHKATGRGYLAPAAALRS